MKPRPVVRPAILAAHAAAGALLLVIVALPVDGNRSLPIERAMFHALNGLPQFLYPPLWVLMQLGNLLALPLAAAISAGTRRFRLALALLAMTPAKLWLAQVIKDNVHRERPGALISDVTRRGDVSATGAAFVSGHAIVAFALATVVSPYLTRPWRFVCWGLAALVCLGRVYVGAHFPLDVMGGAAVGWALGSVANLVIGIPATSDGGAR